jgi:hypothetical protein
LKQNNNVKYVNYPFGHSSTKAFPMLFITSGAPTDRAFWAKASTPARLVTEHARMAENNVALLAVGIRIKEEMVLVSSLTVVL